MEFSWPLLFGFGISKGHNAFLWNFQKWSFVLSWIFRANVEKLKFPGVLSKRYILNPPSLVTQEGIHSKSIYTLLRETQCTPLNCGRPRSFSPDVHLDFYAPTPKKYSWVKIKDSVNPCWENVTKKCGIFTDNIYFSNQLSCYLSS